MLTPDRTQAPAVSELSGLRLPAISTRTLPNGIRLVILDSGSQPVIRLKVVWDGGLLDCPNPAAMRLMAATINEGTDSRTGADIAGILELNGAWTRYDVDSHQLSATLFSLNDRAAEVLPVFTDVISSPVFPDEIIDTQRQKLAANCEVERRKVTTRVQEIWRPMCFGQASPRSRVTLPGDYLMVGRDDVLSVFRRLVRSNAPTVYLAGRVTPELLKIVSDSLSAMEFLPLPDAITPVYVQAQYNPKGDFRTALMEESLQSAIRLSIPAIDRRNSDYAPLRYAVMGLGGYFGSRLMMNIREDKGYTYGINAAMITPPREGSFMTVSCQTDNRYVDAVLEETHREIDNMCSAPIPEEELTGLRRLVLSSLASVLDSPFSAMDYVATLDLLDLPYSYYSYQVDTIEQLTPQEIQRVMALYLGGVPSLTAVAGNYKPKS